MASVERKPKAKSKELTRHKVYLAGPISGCNEEQRDRWRKELRNGFSEEFEFVDPTDNILDGDQSDYEVVKADQDAIAECDAVLAYMWKESIGTALGILHAHSASRVVVVVDPNRLNSRMAAFYADAISRDLHHGLNAIRIHLSATSRISAVRKSDGEEEPFERQKLSLAIRKACLAARQSDIVPSRAILTATLHAICGDDPSVQRVVTSTEIQDAVWNAIAELGADKKSEADYDAIRRAWDSHAEAGEVQTARAYESAHPINISEKPLEVKLGTMGNHSTIWGSKIGKEAKQIFDQIKRVEGITEIILRQFKNTGSPPSKPHVRLTASKTPNVIDGNCYDHGPKGTLQTFQIKVADERLRDRIMSVLRDHLYAVGHMRQTE